MGFLDNSSITVDAILTTPPPVANEVAPLAAYEEQCTSFQETEG